MKRSIAELITRDPEKFAHHDRVFKNNPVVMQGMGLAPLVVLATTGKNALMLAVAVALLLTPSRMLACLVSRLFPLRDEQPAPEELEKKLLPRALVYSGSAAVVCIFEHAILRAVKGPRSGLLIRILPIAAVNSGVLGTVLVERTQSFTLAQSIGFGLGSGLGYLLAVMLVTEAGNRLRSKAIPEAFRGLPITLIYIGVLALAIYGFTGHSVIL